MDRTRRVIRGRSILLLLTKHRAGDTVPEEHARVEINEDPTNLCTRLYVLGYGEGVNQLGIEGVNPTGSLILMQIRSRCSERSSGCG